MAAHSMNYSMITRCVWIKCLVLLVKWKSRHWFFFFFLDRHCDLELFRTLLFQFLLNFKKVLDSYPWVTLKAPAGTSQHHLSPLLTTVCQSRTLTVSCCHSVSTQAFKPHRFTFPDKSVYIVILLLLHLICCILQSSCELTGIHNLPCCLDTTKSN